MPRDVGSSIGSIIGHRGQTVLPVRWNVVKEVNGSRIIEGIAYNAAIHGERRRVTCSDKVWFDPDEDVFYWDEAIRWTVDELRGLNLHGVPLRIQHQPNEDLPAVGYIVDNFVDSDGHLHIIGEIPNNGPDDYYARAAISLIDNGACQELSVGYPLERNPKTKEVTHLGIDEVSFVTEAHFRGCKVNVRANKGRTLPDDFTSAPYTSYTTVRAARTKKKTEEEDDEEDFSKKVKENSSTLRRC